MADDENLADDERITLKIDHHFPEGLQLMFSDNIAVQHTQSEFIITFAQILQPLISDASEYEQMTTVRADVVARIVLTPAKMVEFIKALQDNWTIYQRRMKALMEAKSNVGPNEPAKNPTSEHQSS